MMKTVLWLCNRPIEGTADRRDGTWFIAMARALAESGRIRLAVVSQAKVKDAVRCDFGDIAQWVVPFEPLNRKGLPSNQTIESIKQAAAEIKPDIIHVWGTENYWGLLTARGILSQPSILEIQGFKYACAKVYYGDLTLSERLKCIGPFEILRPNSSFLTGGRRFEKWGRFEKEMIFKHRYISTQSDWVRTHIKAINPGCTLFKTGMMLRKEFFEAKPWTLPKNQDSDYPCIFASSSYAVPYKGLHVLIKALSILKRRYPQIVLNIAGDIMKKGIRQRGYSRWLQRLIYKLNIENNVRWLGPIDANQIVKQFQKASAVVIPSFIETYSLTLAEAMLVGVPLVASFAGAMPELAKNDESALFFPQGDETVCAWQIERILKDQNLACHLSQNTRQIGQVRNEQSTVVKRQIAIYNEILNEAKQK